MKKSLLAILALLLVTACGTKTPDAPEGKTLYKVGVHGGDSLLAWKEVVRVLKEEEGVDLEIVTFGQYPEPNAALNSKEIDLNAFQHHLYLEQEIADFKYDIAPIADTYIAPMGAYSATYKTLNEVKDGDKVLIPDDVTNGGRALNLLEANGLIELTNEANTIPSIKDVVNTRNLEIIQIEAANIPGSLDEVNFAVINSGIAVDAKLDPKATLFIEQVDLNNKEPFKQYINLIAVRTADLEDPILKKIVEIYHTDAIAELVDQDSNGANIPVW